MSEIANWVERMAESTRQLRESEPDADHPVSDPYMTSFEGWDCVLWFSSLVFLQFVAIGEAASRSSSENRPAGRFRSGHVRLEACNQNSVTKPADRKCSSFVNASVIPNRLIKIKEIWSTMPAPAASRFAYARHADFISS